MSTQLKDVVTDRGYVPTVFTIPRFTRFNKNGVHVHFEKDRVTVMKFTDTISVIRDLVNPTPAKLEELIKTIEKS